MKIKTNARVRGFTLVELLVVIAIIAVLAGAGFAGGKAAMEKAKKVTALATCTEVEQAVNNFFTEYGSLPVNGASDLTVTSRRGDASGIDLLIALLGKETTDQPLNARGVKFLNLKEGKADKNGAMYTGAGTTLLALYDPWGGAYNIMLDADYNEVLAVRPKGANTTKTLNGRRVAVWSDGNDGAKIGSTGKITDDVITW